MKIKHSEKNCMRLTRDNRAEWKDYNMNNFVIYKSTKVWVKTMKQTF